jgi:hypothetical protein
VIPATAEQRSFPSRKGLGATLAGIVSLAAGIVSAALLVTLMLKDSTVLPFWDHWAFVQELANSSGRYTLAQLWQQHNEHRIVLPRLLMLLDFHLFHARNTFLLWSTFVLQALQALLFYLVLVALRFGRSKSMVLFGLTIAILFSPVQLDNFVWAFQITFILATVFTSVALYLLSRALRDREGAVPAKGKQMLAFSIAAAICATLSLASGLFVWPIMFAAAVLLRRSWHVPLIILLCWMTITALYLHGYHSPAAHGDPLASLKHPALVAEYLSLYIGGPWISYGHAVAITTGLAGILFGLLLLLTGVIRHRSLTWPEAFLLSVIATVLATAFITALGRLQLGLDQASAGRYQTVSLLVWAAISVLSIHWVSSTAGKSSDLSWILIAAFAAVAWSPMAHFKSITGPYAGRAGQWRVAEAALSSGVADYEMENTLADSRQFPLPIKFLRERRLSLFSETGREQLGSRLSTYYVTSSRNECVGAVQGSQVISDLSQSGLRMSGWAWDRLTNRPVQRIIITDDANKIIGFGVDHFASITAERLLGMSAGLAAGWFGYGGIHQGMNSYRTYGVVGDGRHVCVIDPQARLQQSFGYTTGQMSPLITKLSESRPGIFRKGEWWQDVDHNGIWNPEADKLTVFGQAGDIPIVGDWDGTGKLRIGVFCKGHWWLDMNGNRKWDQGVDKVLIFGQAGDIPVVGDWDGTGRLRIGVFRNGQWWLDMNGNNKWDQGVDKLLVFGQAGDIPVVGDWDGTGKLRPGVFRKGQWWLDMNGDFKWQSGTDKLVEFGASGDSPVIGNWDSIGKLRIGVFRGGRWLLDMAGNYAMDKNMNRSFVFGQPGDVTTVLQWPVN